MGALVFDNTNLVSGLCGGCSCVGFAPAATFVYNAGAKTIAVTDASVYGAGDGKKIMHVRVSDKYGKKAYGSTAGASVTVDVSGLDLSEGYQFFVTIVTNLGCISDGHVGNNWLTALAAGSVGSWDKDANTVLTLSHVHGGDDDLS